MASLAFHLVSRAGLSPALAVMAGSAASVPCAIRVGGEEIVGTLDFGVARRNLWRTRPGASPR